MEWYVVWMRNIKDIIKRKHLVDLDLFNMADTSTSVNTSAAFVVCMHMCISIYVHMHNNKKYAFQSNQEHLTIHKYNYKMFVYGFVSVCIHIERSV